MWRALFQFPVLTFTVYYSHCHTFRVSLESVSFIHIESFPCFFLFISKNFCWNTSCGNKVSSNHTLKAERDSPCAADCVMTSPFLSKTHVKSHTVTELWAVTLAASSVWDRSGAWNLMKHNFGIPNTVWKLVEVIIRSSGLCLRSPQQLESGSTYWETETHRLAGWEFCVWGLSLGWSSFHYKAAWLVSMGLSSFPRLCLGHCTPYYFPCIEKSRR